MTFEENLNLVLLAGAGLCKHEAQNDLQKSQQEIVKDEILYNEMFATPMKKLYDDSYVFEGKQGCIPTTKGWKQLHVNTLTTKVVEKMVPKPTSKMTDLELLSQFIESGYEICHRLPNGKMIQKHFKEQYQELASVLECVTGTSNNVLFPEVEQEPEG